MYYVYMLRCKDNSIYTGITTELARRMQEHISQNEKCAKYTLHHTAQRLEVAWITQNKALASKLEYHIKHLSKLQKEKLIQEGKSFAQIIGSKVEIENYQRMQKKDVANINQKLIA